MLFYTLESFVLEYDDHQFYEKEINPFIGPSKRLIEFYNQIAFSSMTMSGISA